MIFYGCKSARVRIKATERGFSFYVVGTLRRSSQKVLLNVLKFSQIWIRHPWQCYEISFFNKLTWFPKNSLHCSDKYTN